MSRLPVLTFGPSFCRSHGPAFSSQDIWSFRFPACIFSVPVIVVMVALWNRADHYIFALWFLLSFFLFSSPNLSDRRLDECLPYFHTWCSFSANLGCRSETCCMVNFGPLPAEICWRVWGTPAHFNGFRVLAALLHGSQVVGVSQTLRH